VSEVWKRMSEPPSSSRTMKKKRLEPAVESVRTSLAK
jgi:hypothetical protein